MEESGTGISSSHLDGCLVYDGLVVERRDCYVPLSDAGLGGTGRVVIQPSLAVLPLAAFMVVQRSDGAHI